MGEEIDKSNQQGFHVSSDRTAGRTGSGWEELVRSCAQGDQEALAALYDQSSALVYSVAHRLLSNPADAEEVTVDVYNQVWRTARNFETSRGSVTAWLVMLARSRAIDRIRSSAKRTRVESPIIESMDLPASGIDPEEATEAGQQRLRIRAAMARLPAEQRVTVELAFFSGLSHSELAGHLGLPLGTVKTRIRSSMMKLRESLGEYA
jgi:RNA polymerase sigma-70 factor (ECF subfamily)